MDARMDLLRQSVTASASQLSETLHATSKNLERISEQQAASPPDQKVLVQHKVPRVLADLVKGQFHLMQEWLRPILSESLENGRDLEKLRSQLEAMLKNYQQMESVIEPGDRNITPPQ